MSPGRGAVAEPGPPVRWPGMAAELRPPVVAAMLDRMFYPGRPSRVELRETHISWVLLAGDLVYKVKKPVELPFVDQRALDRRRELCEAEVRLNRRLAPEIYLGVRAIVRAREGFALADADAPDAVEYAVEMRRFDEDDTLERRLDRRALDPAGLHRVARILAGFHADAPRVGNWSEAVAELEGALDETFHTLSAVGGGLLDRRRLAAAERFADAFLAARAGDMTARARHGLVREGHGDLRLEHVIFGDAVLIVDCVEFDPALRRIDVSCDLAFLVMELVARDRADLADDLVWAYRDAGGDPGDDPLIAFHAAYRALVRAKVAVLRADQLFATNPERDALLAEANRFVEVAARFAWCARLPGVLVLAGVPGSGKSHLAGALAEVSEVRVLASDVTRKDLLGVAPTDRAPSDAYETGMNERTYRALGRRACAETAVCGTVVVDATFRHAAERAAFLEELGDDVAVVFVECIAPAAVIWDRVRARESNPSRVSDATAAIAERERGSWEPLDDVPPDRHLMLRTDRPVAALLADVAAALDHRLATGYGGSENMAA